MGESCRLPQPCRILVVESASELRRFMAVLLEDEGHTVATAATTGEATTLIGASAFDLVITDSFGLGSEDALESISEVLQAAGPTPVVLCTGHRVRLDDLRGAGVRGLIRKPFEVDAFLAQVNELCGVAGAAA